MKKIFFIVIAVMLNLCFIHSSYAADCSLMSHGLDANNNVTAEMVEGEVSDILNNCLQETGVYVSEGKVDIEGGLKTTILSWTQTIALMLGLLSVFGIVLGSLFLTLSGGNDERVNKGKNIIKWSILGVLAVMFAGTIIVLIVNIMYSI